MSLTPGTKLGPYEIQAPVGAGGMGEVYRARDLRLERTVAVKILPTHLSANADAKQRFDREARTISSLNHPNICTLFDVGHQDGTDFLVMEYLEGETLADRLRKGPMPLAQLLKAGIEICDGLDRAHRSGVVHRDLKPGNVMLTKSGAKLMDFGLAKASLASASAVSNLSMTLSTPAQSHPLTAAGTVVGTFQYMAPEQVEGKEADARADIFALGAVLYEMATGKRAFEGKSAATVMAAVLERDPAPISTFQPTAPPALDRLVKTCLAKDPDERWQTAHDVKLQLKHIADGATQSSAAVPAIPVKKKHAPGLAWVVAGVLGLVAIAAVAWTFLKEKPARLLRVQIAAPAGAEFNVSGDNSGPAMLSPDGHYLVFSGKPAGKAPQLYLRALDDLEARALPGTEDARFPFWSPDSKTIAFFNNDRLARIDVDGSAPVTICDSALGRGGSWAPDGNIIAAISYNTTVSIVPASGGTPHELFKLDANKYSSYRWPWILPDGKHFLYSAVNHADARSPDTGVFYASTDGRENRLLIHTFSSAIYASGYLIYERERSMIAQPFDAANGKFTGEPQTLREDVQLDNALWRANVSASTNGLLEYASAAANGTQALGWYDRTGKLIESMADLGNFQEVELSPNEKKVALTDINTAATNIWVYDFGSRALKNRLAYSSGAIRGPVWSPDGTRIAYSSNQSGALAIKAVSGGAPEQVLLTASDHSLTSPTSWSRDGKLLMFQQGYGLNERLQVLALGTNSKPVPYATDSSIGLNGQFSPDGHWVSYLSMVNGQPQIFVAPYPWTGERWQISQAYGIESRWAADGKSIYFFDSGGISQTQVSAKGSSFQVGSTQRLFAVSLPGQSTEYDVTHDGKRILLLTQGASSNEPLTLVQNWTAQLKQH